MVEVEAGLPVFVTKGIVDTELAVRLIEANEIEAMVAIWARSDDDAAGRGVPAGPMGEIVAGERDARDLDRLIWIGNIQRDDAVDGWDALDGAALGFARIIWDFAGNPTNNPTLAMLG